MRKTFLYIAVLVLAAVPTSAAGGIPGDGIGLSVRAGYSVGGTAPLDMPASIRGVDAFRFTPSLCAGADIMLPLVGAIGITTGLHLENKAMDASVTVKGYHMAMSQGGSTIEGVFTGHVRQQVTQWMLTLPLQATLAVGDKLTLRVGPYASLLVKKEFKGEASDGYLRQGDPTGPRINIGDTPETAAAYDFSDDMRPWQVGIGFGGDWQFAGRLALTADLNWGLSAIFGNDFTVVEQKLYPIYGTVGLRYTF